jgi:hypothetical protein
LYNIKEDALESQNLYFQYPEKVNQLSGFMEEIIEKGYSNQNY